MGPEIRPVLYHCTTTRNKFQGPTHFKTHIQLKSTYNSKRVCVIGFIRLGRAGFGRPRHTIHFRTCISMHHFTHLRKHISNTHTFQEAPRDALPTKDETYQIFSTVLFRGVDRKVSANCSSWPVRCSSRTLSHEALDSTCHDAKESRH